MKVIITKRPDGGCNITRPAPEMFDPNSRTIRHMEMYNEFFPSVKKVLDSFKPRLDEIRAHYKVAYSLLAEDDPELKQKQADLFNKESAELDVLNFELEQFQLDRRSHKDFSLTAFVDEVWRYIIARNGLAEGTYRIADDTCLPADREFRNAWTDDQPTKTVDVDMSKARVIFRDRMRVARRPLLQELDAEQQRADENIIQTVKKAEIASRKQILRDVTADPAIDAAETPEQLKACWPECLGPRVTHQ